MNLIQLAAWLKEKWTNMEALLSQGVVNAKAVDAANTERDAAKASLAGREAELALTSDALAVAKLALTSRDTELSAAQTRITELSAAQTAAAAQVAQTVASQGIPAKELPAAQTAPAAKTLTLAAFEKLRHEERNEFIRAGGKILSAPATPAA